MALCIACLTLLAGCGRPVPGNQYQDSLPQALSLAEPVEEVAGNSCSAGGFRLFHGLDYNGDGRLSVFERHHEELICNPSPLEATPTTGIALGKPKAPRPEDG